MEGKLGRLLMAGRGQAQVTPRARTNQLLYQVELLLATPVRDDEHQDAHRRACEEGALALFGLALDALLRDVSEHAHLVEHDWHTMLVGDRYPDIAEVRRLRELANDRDSWLGRLISYLDALESDGGASQGTSVGPPGVIAVGGRRDLRQDLRDCLTMAKAEIATLRQTSEEW
ncbi:MULTISPECIES: DUF6586 family protein [Halomonas]|uniref:DUF6586 family protein n=1 Tax=Halomonas TaxID=2745 RepID=UPI001CD6C0F8|nr:MULTISPECIES: DUF6586 family protein [Halomonas]MCA0917527.1 hypothetical protein [Halomonas denitrificans]MED5296067.1 DUF6586 family protein [Pseudomonadota bacterium]